MKAMASSHLSSMDNEDRGVKQRHVGDEKPADPYDRSKLSSATRHAPYGITRRDVKKRTVRLLILHGSRYNRGSHLCIDLMRVHINTENATDPLSNFDAQLPDYDAVSYAWGKSAPDRTIWCTARTPFDYYPKEPFQQALDRSDRGTYLAVSQTVCSILKDLQPCTGYRILWIDAICIDQNNFLDRSEQVPLMSTIYRHARQVIVWLLPPPRTTLNYWSNVSSLRAARATKKLGLLGLRLTELSDERKLQKDNAVLAPDSVSNSWFDELLYSDYVRQEEIDELVTLLAQPWFTRTWVVQGVVLARKVVVEYGKHSIDWDDIAHACHATRDRGPAFNSVASQLRMFSDIELFRRAYRAILHMMDVDGGRTNMTINQNSEDNDLHSYLYL